MAEESINIETFDCLPFNNIHATADVLQQFIESKTKNVFYFSPDFIRDDESPLAEYDYRSYQWKAGRFIGEAFFKHNNRNYKLTIKPRFGEQTLFRMLEKIFNIRITKSVSSQNKNEDWQHYIKKIIAFIWLQKLANANLHGLPKVQIKKENKSYIIKGRVDIRRSAKPLYQSGQVVSINREKEIDSTIAQIIGTAYKVLKVDFPIQQSEISDSAQDAINQICSAVFKTNYVSENDYKSIQYKEIYLSWKPLVDFSWDIIKRKRNSLKQKESTKNGYGFFIDMAEVWEQYLRSILKKGLMPYGWHLQKEKEVAYKGYFYQRELIPDLVFKKQNDIAVWDAKYKRMAGMYFDVDRADFFQIHTYLQHFIYSKSVKAGGLLYPISGELNFKKSTSPYLLNDEGIKINFSIDGVELNEVEKDITEPVNIHQTESEKEFINRLLQSINY